MGGGAVMMTDSSESEAETSKKRLSMQQFKWTVANEKLLEEVLMRHYFDFHGTAKEFSRIIND